jgi:hypothetical protein
MEECDIKKNFQPIVEAKQSKSILSTHLASYTHYYIEIERRGGKIT